jgi:hypothetical protein
MFGKWSGSAPIRTCHIIIFIFIHVEDFSSIIWMNILIHPFLIHLVGEWTGRLVVEQHIGDGAPNILNPIIRQNLDNLTLETRHQINFLKINFIFTMDFFKNSYLPHMASDWNDFYVVGFLL